MAETYPIIGADGAVTSWAGATFYSNLLSKISPNAARIQFVADPFDVTPIGGVTTANLSGLRSTQGTIDARIKLGATYGQMANSGLVTFATGYVEHVRSWDLTIETSQVHDITKFASTGPTWRNRRPDVTRVYGTYTARVDAADDIIAPPTANSVGASMTLRYGDEATDDTILLSALVSNIGTSIVSKQMQEVTCSFVSTGTVTPAGTNSILGSTASELGIPVWEYTTGSSVPNVLTFTAITGKTYIIADAFWSRIRLQCTVDQLLNVSIDWIGNGTPSGTGITIA